ncbi:hypothetical protein MUP38_08125 [Candidatus Bathyarchaeota archaeon]|nr:hypothetical protein [Candidatus Bathyarchaeota archaeon]
MLLELLIVGFWLSFTGYCCWYFFKAKTFQPLTLDDLALTWRMRKQQTSCTASRIQNLLTRNNEVEGFKCECGYEFQQKRLITQKARKRQGFNGNLPHHAFKSSTGKWEEKL